MEAHTLTCIAFPSPFGKKIATWRSTGFSPPHFATWHPWIPRAPKLRTLRTQPCKLRTPRGEPSWAAAREAAAGRSDPFQAVEVGGGL